MYRDDSVPATRPVVTAPVRQTLPGRGHFRLFPASVVVPAGIHPFPFRRSPHVRWSCCRVPASCSPTRVASCNILRTQACSRPARCPPADCHRRCAGACRLPEGRGARACARGNHRGGAAHRHAAPGGGTVAGWPDGGAHERRGSAPGGWHHPEAAVHRRPGGEGRSGALPAGCRQLRGSLRQCEGIARSGAGRGTRGQTEGAALP